MVVSFWNRTNVFKLLLDPLGKLIYFDVLDYFMDYKYYEAFTNKKPKSKYDVTLIFQHPKAFSNLIIDLIKPFKNTDFNKVAGLEALGFILGGAVACKLRKGFVPVRKKGKLPDIKGAVIRASFIDYTKNKKTFEMNKSAIKKGDKVLIVDDLIETGSQARSAIKLIEKQGGKVIGITVMCAERTPKAEILFEKYNCKAIKIFDK